MKMTEDEEFGDEIDWSTVRLPLTSALSAVKSNCSADGIAMTTSSGSGGTAPPSLRHSLVGSACSLTAAPCHTGNDPPQNCAVAGGENLFGRQKGSIVQALDNHVALALGSANPNADVLRRQVQDLQSQVKTKDDLIFELEATAAASAAESTHRVCQAEDDARKRVHLAEEELRRVRMEAEKYRGSLMRHKRRVAELEAAQRKSADCVGGSNRPRGHQQIRSNCAHFDEPPPLDLQLRKVTPSISNEEVIDHKVALADDDECKSSKNKKRKAGKFPETNALSKDAMAYLHQHVIGLGRWEPGSGGSARQWLVKHLLNRVEMGFYSFGGGGMADAAMFLPRKAHLNCLNKTQLRQPKQLSSNLNDDAMQQDILFERETQKIVKSILYQMMEAQDDDLNMLETHSISISGFVHIMLVKFNSLFQCIDSKQGGDGNHVMGQENDRCDSMLILPRSTVMSEENNSSTAFLECANSWRAALYLLSILHDTILISRNARDDLRWWCYQSCELSVAGDLSNTNSPCSAEGALGGRADIANGASLHMRIEGLPAGGPLGSEKPIDSWDPVSMGQPCKIFFELVVALMKGDVFKPIKSRNLKEDISTRWEYTVVLFVQLKAIDLVFAMMSDAPSYDHAGDSHGNRTPYLWKFLFESLFPLYRTAPKFERHWDKTTSTGDFFSPWENSEEQCDQSLGSGRKHITRILSCNPNNMTWRKQGAEKNDCQMNSEYQIRRENMKQQEQLSVIIRARILDLISHFMLCSSPVCHCMQQTFGKHKTSLSKRILAAVLDDIEGYILPFMSYCSHSNYHVHGDLSACLQLCFSCIQILLSMLRLDDGTRMMRLQMRLESHEGEPSRWSQSAIGCVTSLLDVLLSFPTGIEKRGCAFDISGHLNHELNAIVDECVIFFKTILMSVYRQRNSSKAATFSALISEHKTVFSSCCQRILAHRSLLQFCDALKCDVRDFVEEMMIDEKEESHDVK